MHMMAQTEGAVCNSLAYAFFMHSHFVGGVRHKQTGSKNDYKYDPDFFLSSDHTEISAVRADGEN